MCRMRVIRPIDDERHAQAAMAHANDPDVLFAAPEIPRRFDETNHPLHAPVIGIGSARMNGRRVHGRTQSRTRALTAALLVVGSLLATVDAQRALLPVDEAAGQPDFFSLRAQLQRAIATRDVPALLAVVHPAIKNSFGGNDGIAQFRKVWAVDSPSSRLWDELGTVLALGGAFHDADTFVAPYVFARWPEEVDAFAHLAVVGARVNVRASAHASAAVVDAVSFEILPVATPRAPVNEAWVAVQLRGRIGYVAAAYTRSPVDYRAIFSKRDGSWRLVTFVAGD